MSKPAIPNMLDSLKERVAFLHECTTKGETEHDRKSAELALKKVRLLLSEATENADNACKSIKKAA